LATTAAIIEYAAIYDLTEENDALATLKKKSAYEFKLMADERASSVAHRSTVQVTAEKEMEKNQFISRASTAVSRVLAVVAPMLIMSLYATRRTQLLATSLFVARSNCCFDPSLDDE
jgi:hypothetical protein